MPTPDVSRISDTVAGGMTIYQQVLYTTQDLANGFIERIPYFVAALIVLCIFWLLSILFKKVVHKILGARVRHQNLVKVFQRIGGALILFIGFMIAMVVALPGFTPAGRFSRSLSVNFAKKYKSNPISGNFLTASNVMPNTPV